MNLPDVQDFPIESRWNVVYPKGKRLSPTAAVFREHQLHAASGWA